MTDTTLTQYRVCWKSKLTQASGKGMPLTREAAQLAIDNAGFKADIEHWLEPVPVRCPHCATNGPRYCPEDVARD